MRTTIRLDDQLLRDAKREAVVSGRTLTQVIEDALREVLARRKAPAPRKRLKLRVFDGGGLQPGVDLDDSAALLDIMEGHGATPGR
jgi:hypothetical protein